jgi:hypothetical protein
MFDISIAPTTTERKNYYHQETPENRAGALTLLGAYLIQVIGKILFP